jgi:gamma-F420-2:alpha-L-glutamate ligase
LTEKQAAVLNMEIWILSNKAEDALAHDYELMRILDVVSEQGHSAHVYSPEIIDIAVAPPTPELAVTIRPGGTQVPLPDLVLPRMGTSTSYRAFAVMRALEHAGVVCINTASAIAAGYDKFLTSQLLDDEGLPTPRTLLGQVPVDSDLVGAVLGFPVVVKAVTSSKGRGVRLCETPADLADFVEFLKVFQPRPRFLLQQFVATSRGHDLRAFVIGGELIACMERWARPGEFKANFSRGASVNAYEPDPELVRIVTETARVLGLDYAGVDLLFTNAEGTVPMYTVCEVNTSPGFEGLEKIHPELNLVALLLEYARERILKHNDEIRFHIAQTGSRIQPLTDL